MAKRKQVETPTLNRLMAEGTVRVDEKTGTFVGTAADGVEVCLGDTRNPEGAERYLSANPRPDQW